MICSILFFFLLSSMQLSWQNEAPVSVAPMTGTLHTQSCLCGCPCGDTATGGSYSVFIFVSDSWPPKPRMKNLILLNIPCLIWITSLLLLFVVFKSLWPYVSALNPLSSLYWSLQNLLEVYIHFFHQAWGAFAIISSHNLSVHPCFFWESLSVCWCPWGCSLVL